MECKVLTLTFEDCGDGNGLQLKSEDLSTMINLEASETADLKGFFDSVFEYIIKNELIIQFELQKKEVKTLYKNVAEDFVSQINNEIKASESNFNEIITLKKAVK